MMFKQPSIVYVDVDRSEFGIYEYRKPHFEAAASLGWKCITLLDIGHEHKEKIANSSDEIVTLNSITSKGIVDAVSQLQENYNIKALIYYPGQNVPGLDVFEVIEEACCALKLTYIPANALKRCNNKFLMRKRLDSLGISNIQSALIQDDKELELAARNIGFPLIFKPIFGAGSALISKCNNLDDLKFHYEKFKKAYNNTACAYYFGGSEGSFQSDDGKEYTYNPGNTAMLEAYIDGLEGTVECIVHEGKPITLLLHEKMLVTHESSTVLEHLLIVPSTSFSEDQISQIMTYCEACISAMELDNAFVHFEFRITDKGPKVIEINPRIGGFFVPKSLKHFSKIDPFLTNLLLLSNHLDVRNIKSFRDIISEPIKKEYYTMFVLYPPISGRISQIDGVEKVIQYPEILDFSFISPRWIDRDSEEGYIAKFWGKASSRESVMHLYNKVLENLEIKINNVKYDE